MKLFPQLALVSAITISGNAMAMQALDDDSLQCCDWSRRYHPLHRATVTNNFDWLQDY